MKVWPFSFFHAEFVEGKSEFMHLYRSNRFERTPDNNRAYIPLLKTVGGNKS